MTPICSPTHRLGECWECYADYLTPAGKAGCLSCYIMRLHHANLLRKWRSRYKAIRRTHPGGQ
jgi:hypothetical protein